MKKIIVTAIFTFAYGMFLKADNPMEDQFKSLQGSLFFHRYSTYDALDSKLFLLDLPSLKLVELSKHWDIIHPMNAHLARNGKWLTFMGMRPSDHKWSIYLWNLNPMEKPLNLTEDSFWRNEDPKFSYDSSKIVFKCDGDLCLYDMKIKEIKILLSSIKEISMPYWHPSNQKIVFSTGARSTSNLESLDLDTGLIKEIYTTPQVAEYYPITFNKYRFYFVQWLSDENHFDQIYFGYFNGRNPYRLPFNRSNVNSSDTCKVTRDLLFFSRHSKEDGAPATGYDLYLGHNKIDSIYKLPLDINTNGEELGCHYYRERFPILTDFFKSKNDKDS